MKSKLASLFEEYMSLASKSSSNNTSMSFHSGIDDNVFLPRNSDSGCMDVLKIFMIIFPFNIFYFFITNTFIL